MHRCDRGVLPAGGGENFAGLGVGPGGGRDECGDQACGDRPLAAGFQALRYTWPRLQDDPDGVLTELTSVLAQSEPTTC